VDWYFKKGDRMAQFSVNDGSGFQMSYEVIEGVLPETTLFIHGNLASNRWWYPVGESFRKMNKNKNLKGSMILAEFRGCGKSSAPKSVEEVNMHKMAGDFVALVKNLQGAPLHVVGHSTGGLIAALMLAQAPELFKKGVFLDPVGARGVKFDDSMTAAFEMMKKDKNLVATVMAGTIHNNKPDSDFFRQIVVEDAFHAVNTVGVWVLKNLDGLDIRQQVSQIQHPVLVLHGEHDQLLPVNDSQEMAALMKNGKFEMVSGHGHCLNAENPDRFAEILSNFLFI
jgi:3-oxoadipate enol-lactonase